MIFFVLTVATYCGLLLFLQPPPESLKAQKLSFKENLLTIKGTLFSGVFLCVLFLATSDFGFLKISDDSLLRWGLSNQQDFGLWTLAQVVSHVFLHHDLLHLIANLSGIAIAGSLYERRVGTKKFLKVLGLSALTSTLSIFFFSQPIIVCGISGAVFGLATAYFLDFDGLSTKDFLMALSGFFVLFVLYSFLPASNATFGDTEVKIDHLGHLFGAIGAIVYLRNPFTAGK